MKDLGTRVIVVFVAIVALAACMQTVRRGAAPDLVFSHAGHQEMTGGDCALCHESAAEKTTASARLLPEMAICLQCHDMEADCAKCHPGNPDDAEPRPQPAEDLVFSHAGHLERGLSCSPCHQNVAESESVRDRLMPTMSSCLECHDGNQATASCEACHINLKDKKLVPRSHDTEWLADHRLPARTDEQTCLLCHRQSECAGCHQGRVDRLVHSRNFRYTHSLAARHNPRTCTVCHETGYCRTCHGSR